MMNKHFKAAVASAVAFSVLAASAQPVPLPAAANLPAPAAPAAPNPAQVARTPMGHVTQVNGLVTVSDGRTVRTVTANSPVYSGTLYVTGTAAGATLALDLPGGCNLSLGPGQAVVVTSGPSCQQLAAGIQGIKSGLFAAASALGPLGVLAALGTIGGLGVLAKRSLGGNSGGTGGDGAGGLGPNNGNGNGGEGSPGSGSGPASGPPPISNE